MTDINKPFWLWHWVPSETCEIEMAAHYLSFCCPVLLPDVGCSQHHTAHQM